MDERYAENGKIIYICGPTRVKSKKSMGKKDTHAWMHAHIQPHVFRDLYSSCLCRTNTYTYKLGTRTTREEEQ